jgi:hypothetical protein
MEWRTVPAMRTLELFALGALAACGAASARTPATHPPAAIASLQWLSGHWCLQRGPELVEEAWLEPRGGLMLGMSRTLRDGNASGFEFMRIEPRDGVPTYLAQPEGAPPTAFRLTASGMNWVRFENPQHDFPKRVEYRRLAKDRLQAQIAGPGKHGAEQVIAFDYIACPAR